MYHEINKLYKGLLFIFIDINIFVVDILADSLGLFFMTLAALNLYKKYDINYFKHASICFAVVIPFALLNDFIVVSQVYETIRFAYTLMHGLMVSLGLAYTFVALKPLVDPGLFDIRAKLYIMLNLLLTLLLVFDKYQGGNSFGLLLVVVGIFNFLAAILLILEVRLLKKSLEPEVESF